MKLKILFILAAALPFAAGDERLTGPAEPELMAPVSPKQVTPAPPAEPEPLSGPQQEFAAMGENVTSIDVKPEDRPFMRYITLWPSSADEHASLVRSVTFALNGLHYRPTIVKPVLVNDGKMLRIDLRELEWDAAARAKRLAIFESRGAVYSFADDAAKQKFLNIWEKITEHEPYFRAGRIIYREEKRQIKVPAEKPYTKDGATFDYYVKDEIVKIEDHSIKGWIDPILHASTCKLLQSDYPIVRADWFLTQVGFDRDAQRKFGYYSDILMLPAKEDQVYKVFGIDLLRIDQDYLKHGGAVGAGQSIVAKHNRELQLLPSVYGREAKFMWRTFDTKSNVGKESVIENTVGTVAHAGREMIWSLPSGLHAYYLANGTGDQVGEVPIDIASDPFDPHDERVINAYKCISCHGPAQGIQPFSDIIQKLMLSPQAYLLNYSKKKNPELYKSAEDYYLYDTPAAIRRQQQAYINVIADVAGENRANLTPEAQRQLTTTTSRAYVGTINSYLHETIDLKAAAKEMGLDIKEAELYLLRSGNQSLLAVAAGQRIARDTFEQAYQDAMRAADWPWDPKP